LTIALGPLPIFGNNGGNNLKRKQDEKEEPKVQRCSQGKRVDYRYLHDPFPDEEDELNKATLSLDEELFAIEARDELTSLEKAKNSPDWPEWEKAIKAELTSKQTASKHVYMLNPSPSTKRRCTMRCKNVLPSSFANHIQKNGQKEYIAS
ncbi:hypothetical protein BYT27DRAFT_7215842, partial [Phlegmacium glaucopus]